MTKFDFLRDLYKTLEAYDKDDGPILKLQYEEGTLSTKEKIKLAKEEGMEAGFIKGVRQQNQQFTNQIRNIIITYLELS